MLTEARLAELAAPHGQEAAALRVPYLYRPIPYFGGRVLKCAGIATSAHADGSPGGSRAIVAEKAKDAGQGITRDGFLPGFIELPEYHGDRIYADSHAEYTGF
jgi:hypothetical protein